MNIDKNVSIMVCRYIFIYKERGQGMRKEILSIITEHLTNERLDQIIVQTEEYRQAEQEENYLSERFEEMLDMEQRKAFNQYQTAENNRIATYIALTYQQGMKDVVNIFLSLAGEMGKI